MSYVRRLLFQQNKHTQEFPLKCGCREYEIIVSAEIGLKLFHKLCGVLTM